MVMFAFHKDLSRSSPEMVRRISFPAFYTALASILITYVSSGQDPSPTYSHEEDGEGDCTFYMAESSISGAGMGLFTTESIAVGDPIFGHDGVAVPVIDSVFQQKGRHPKWSFLDYTWEPSSPELKFEADDVHVLEFSPIATLPNYHTALKNVVARKLGSDFNIVAQREKDAEAGAFSYHTGQSFAASRNIDAGEELFDNYGESWLDERIDRFESVPRSTNFEKADAIVHELAHLERSLGGSSSEEVDSILSTMRSVVSLFDITTASLLPTKSPDMKNAAVSSTAWRTVQNRTISWIRENGRCVDNLIPGNSTNKQAGKGAFAKRSISKGQLIAPIPLLHIIDKSTLNIYNRTLGKNGLQRRTDQELGKQLLLNYCFGHEESSLLFCQSTGSALVNHRKSVNIDRQSEEETCLDGPNAEIVWSTWDSTTQKWLSMSFEELSKQQGRGLSFDLVATRDIQKGDEVFIDYGAAWHNAWNEHLLRWSPPTEKYGEFVDPDRMNVELPSVETKDELAKKPYPPNIMTACIYHEENEEKQKKQLTIDLPDDELIDYFSITGDHFLPGWRNGEHDKYYPCTIYERYNDETYTVRIFENFQDYQRMTDSGRLPRIVTDYPRKSIRFITKPYMSDIHLPSAFRFPLGIRDDIFPSQWKNLPSDQRTES